MGSKIRKVRAEKGMTQAQLSRKSGVSRTTISGLETGKITVTTTATLIKIADALETTVDAIFFPKCV
jgi:transcriptional regulator with XRE-family HTH domain